VFLIEPKQERHVAIRLRRDGAVEVANAPFNPNDWLETTVGPLPNQAIRPTKEFNTLLVTLRRGRTLEVFANGAAIGDPIELNPPIGRCAQAFALWQRGKGSKTDVRAEFRQFTVWLLK
jgi:hypothetical protein